jgi:hypothetical protein
MNSKIVNLQASVTQRLRNIAREKQASLEVILRRYAIERLLYRITQSPERNRFVLKGAMLYTAWVADSFRPTQDLDLLGLGDDAAPAMAEAFRAICQQKVPRPLGAAGLHCLQDVRLVSPKPLPGIDRRWCNGLNIGPFWRGASRPSRRRCAALRCAITLTPRRSAS